MPTAAVHSNLTLIQKRSSYTVWEQARASVRSPTGTAPSGYTPPTRLCSTSSPAKNPLFPNAAYPPLQKGTTPRSPTKSPTPAPEIPQPTPDMTNQELDLTGDDTTATHSQMTKSMTTTQTKFAEIEAAIRRQQQSIRQNQEELTNINARTLTTLSLVQTTTDDVLQLIDNTTRQITELRNEIRREAAAQAEAQQIGFANMMALFRSLTSTTTPTTQFDSPPTQLATETPSRSDSDNDSETSVHDDMSSETKETNNQSSAYAKSPEKKRNKRTTRDPSLKSIRRSLNSSAQHDQEPRAHYTSDSTPDNWAT